jgi:hypothetical protein
MNLEENIFCLAMAVYVKKYPIDTMTPEQFIKRSVGSLTTNMLKEKTDNGEIGFEKENDKIRYLPLHLVAYNIKQLFDF